MDKTLGKFYIQLSIALAIVFLIHIGVLNFLDTPLFQHKIILSYLINFILAVGIFTVLYILRDKQKNNLGFLFIAGSFMKFLVFFLVFYPSYKLDGEMSTLEFSTFFIPYLVCLVFETFSLSKLLNKLY